MLLYEKQAYYLCKLHFFDKLQCKHSKCDIINIKSNEIYIRYIIFINWNNENDRIKVIVNDMHM